MHPHNYLRCVCFLISVEVSPGAVHLLWHSQQSALSGRSRQPVINLYTAVRDCLMEGIMQQYMKYLNVTSLSPCICEHMSVLFPQIFSGLKIAVQLAEGSNLYASALIRQQEVFAQCSHTLWHHGGNKQEMKMNDAHIHTDKGLRN